MFGQPPVFMIGFGGPSRISETRRADALCFTPGYHSIGDAGENHVKDRAGHAPNHQYQEPERRFRPYSIKISHRMCLFGSGACTSDQPVVLGRLAGPAAGTVGV